jgi:hypothetical protein
MLRLMSQELTNRDFISNTNSKLVLICSYTWPCQARKIYIIIKFIGLKSNDFMFILTIKEFDWTAVELEQYPAFHLKYNQDNC